MKYRIILLVIINMLIITIGMSWSKEVQWATNGIVISDASGNQSGPQIVSDNKGGAIIVWPFSNKIYAQRVDSNGTLQWAPSGVVICSNFGAYLAVASDGNNGAIISWSDTQASCDIYAQKISSAGEVQWTPGGVPICTASEDQNDSQLTSNGNGGAFIAWWDQRNYNDIYCQLVSSNGTTQWGADLAISTHSGGQYGPELIEDGTGGAILCWWDSNAPAVYAKRINENGESLWNPERVCICSDTEAQSDPQIVSDCNGGAIICWRNKDSGTTKYDFFAQRINATGNILWTVDGVPIYDGSYGWLIFGIVSDGDGGAIITYGVPSVPGTYTWDIYAQKINLTGDIQWLSGGIPVCTAPDAQLDPQLVADGYGGAIITWADNRNGDDTWDIYAQAISSSGQCQWSENGIAVSTAADKQIFAQYYSNITTDGNGGAIITWQDYRNGDENIDIYAQYVTPFDIITPAAITDLFAQTGDQTTLSWTAPGDDGMEGQIQNGEFRIQYSTNPLINFSTSVAQINISTTCSPLTTHSYSVTGLTTGTTCYFRIWTRDEVIDNWSDISNGATVCVSGLIPPASVTDLAAIPGTNIGEILLEWTTPGDDGTIGNIKEGKYWVKYSSNSEINGGNWDIPPEVCYELQWIVNTAPGHEGAKLIEGLQQETTWWFAIKTQDENAGNWSLIDSVLPRAHSYAQGLFGPSNFYGTAVSTRSIYWQWEDNSTWEDGYYLYSSNNILIQTLDTNATYYTKINLSPNTKYEYYCKVYNSYSNNNSNSYSCYTLANSPTSLDIIENTAHTISLSWSENGCSRYRIDKSTNNIDWLTLKSWNDGITNDTYNVTELLPSTNYHFTIWGYNGDGIITVGSTTVSGNTQAIENTVIEYDKGGTETEIKVVDGISLIIKVDVPKNTVNQDVYIAITTDPINNPREVDSNKIEKANNKILADPKKYINSDSIIEFNMYDMTGIELTDTFSKDVTITLPYSDEDNDGLVDDTEPPIEEESLTIYVLNEENNKWEMVETGGILDSKENNITVNISHFSVFTIIGEYSFANDLDSVIVRPNPYKPGTGGKYDNPNGIIFDNLTKQANIKIFNIAGELVTTLDEEDGDGKFQWSVKNDDNEKIASGLYIYYIKNPDESSDTKSGKFTVIR